MVAFVFADPCDPAIIFEKIEDNCPDNMCSEDIFSDWQKHFNSIGCQEMYYRGQSHRFTSLSQIALENAENQSRKNLIENRMMYIKSNVEREIYEDNLTFTDTFLSQSKSQASGILKNPKIIRKKINEDSYIVHCYKYKTEYEKDIEQYDNDLIKKSNKDLQEFNDEISKMNPDINLAFEYLSKSYIYASSSYKRSNESEVKNKLTKFLNEISISYYPKDIKAIPAIVNNDQSLQIIGKYKNKPLAGFPLKAFFEVGLNDWENNLNLLRTNKNGETELNIGSILSRTQKQSIILMPHFGKNDISNSIDIPVDILNESYLRLNEIIKSSNSLKIKLDILDRPYLYISFNDKGLNSSTSKLIKQLIVDQSKDQFNECPIDKNIQCIELLVDVKSSKNNKIDISFKYGEFDELIDNIFLKNEISNSNNRIKVKEIINKLHNKLFTADISYSLSENVVLLINDNDEQPISSKKTNSKYVTIPKGKTNLKFFYKLNKNKSILLHEDNIVISNSFDLNDKYEKWSKWSGEDINYRFFTDQKWSDSEIQWDNSVRNKYNQNINGFKDCPNYTCSGNILNEHKLKIRKNGFKPIDETISQPEKLIENYYIPDEILKLQRIKGKIRNYLVPGLGLYDFMKSPGYYQTNKLGVLRGKLTTLLTFFLFFNYLESKNNVNIAKNEYDRWSNSYMNIEQLSSQESYNNAYNNMIYYKNEYNRHQDSSNGALFALGAIYSLNFIEMTVRFGGND